jgi:hypothetical protein
MNSSSAFAAKINSGCISLKASIGPCPAEESRPRSTTCVCPAEKWGRACVVSSTAIFSPTLLAQGSWDQHIRRAFHYLLISRTTWGTWSIARALAWIFATYDLDDLDERDAAASLANIIHLFQNIFFARVSFEYLIILSVDHTY